MGVDMSLEIEATVTKLEKIPTYGRDIEGVRIVAEIQREGDETTSAGVATVWIPLLFSTGEVPPKVGDTIRVEAFWYPINPDGEGM